jgi:high-affinity iron transporter
VQRAFTQLPAWLSRIGTIRKVSKVRLSSCVLWACALTLLVSLPAARSASALGLQSPKAVAGSALADDAQGLHLLLSVLGARYVSAQPAHSTEQAAVVRLLAGGVDRRVLELQGQRRDRDSVATAHIAQTLARLQTLLEPTKQRFQPWPLSLEVSALVARAQRRLDAILPSLARPARAYDAIESALEQAQGEALAGHEPQARFALLRAYALYASGPGNRLRTRDPSLDAKIARELLLDGPTSAQAPDSLVSSGGQAAVARAVAGARTDMALVAQTLDEVQISRTTIVVNGAIIVFREGLEAVLILAAITASFVGAKRHLRRPVMIGALAGLGATLLTWLVAQVMLHMFGDGGLQLQAVTGLVAIGVLLLITNWFFHRMYWSEWIARFNRRRRALERWDGRGFISGQLVGLVLLGVSSVYREGLETVLFLQALQTSAGTGATALGAGIGLGATLIVGAVTFKLQRKLPFKRMLILTGVLIALVLAVMVGTTAHNLQGVGWLPTTPTAFEVPIAWSMWLGVYPTWEGIVAQLGSLAFVLGSYFAAREIQVKRPQRRANAIEAAIPVTVERT